LDVLNVLKDIIRDPDELWQWLMLLSVFGLVLAVWYAAVTAWYLHRSRHREQIRNRLGLQGDAYRQGQETARERVLRLWHDGELVETVVPTQSARSFFQWLDQLRQDAGWTTPMPRVLAMLAIICVLCFAVSFVLLHNVMLGIALPVAILFGFRIYLLRCLRKHTEFFEKQLVDALDLGARSLRAGHPLSGAFRLMSEEMDPPVGTMFTEICEQESLGMSVQDALRQAANRSRSPDMRIFAASVIIQLRSGGNLADMMERVAWVVRERMRLHRRARVLTAEAQLSKWVLLGLPILLFVVLNILNSKYMTPFFTDYWGKMLILIALGMMTLGGWVMGRMAKLKY
jgi:tight adherence protein B